MWKIRYIPNNQWQVVYCDVVVTQNYYENVAFFTVNNEQYMATSAFYSEEVRKIGDNLLNEVVDESGCQFHAKMVG